MTTLSTFISESLNSITNHNFEIEIDKTSITRIKKYTKLNVSEYKFIIEPSYIRHVQNRHEEDLPLLHKIPELINNFTSVEKSITRNRITGHNDVSLVFKKKYADETIRMVSLRLMRDKTLSFKTFFRE